MENRLCQNDMTNLALIALRVKSPGGYFMKKMFKNASFVPE